MAVENDIPQQQFDQPVYGPIRPDNAQGAGRANMLAALAKVASGPIHPRGGESIDGRLRTDLGTAAAMDTSVFGEGNFWGCLLRLRVVAEDAAQWTSLEENDRPNSGAVIQAASSDLND